MCVTIVLVQLGNPETSDADDWRGLVDYAWSHAVISDETHKTIIDNCDFNSSNTWNNEACSKAVDEVFVQYKEIDIYSLYTSVCLGDSASSPSDSLQATMKRSTSTTAVRFKDYFLWNSVRYVLACFPAETMLQGD